MNSALVVMCKLLPNEKKAQRWRCAIKEQATVGRIVPPHPSCKQSTRAGCWASVHDCTVFELNRQFPDLGIDSSGAEGKEKSEPYRVRPQTCCSLERKGKQL
jgi:hypothetical protein